MTRSSTVHIRPRTEADLDACARLARAVHDADGYPVFAPNDDLGDFLVSPDALSAWVAVDQARIVGHVALHRSSFDEVRALIRASLGDDARNVAVIARLLVSPLRRRQGIGSRLLDLAVSEARMRGRVPILDVVTKHTAAIALYEASGWIRLGLVHTTLPDGRTIEELVYRAP